MPIDQIKVIKKKLEEDEIRRTYVVDRIEDHRRRPDDGVSEYVVKP